MEPRVGAVGHTHVALLVHPAARTAPTGEPRWRACTRTSPTAVAAQPGQRRPAARRRSARGLAGCWTWSSWTADWRRVEYPIARGRRCNRRGRAPKQPRRAAIHRAVTKRPPTPRPRCSAPLRWPPAAAPTRRSPSRASRPRRGAAIDERLDEVQRRYEEGTGQRQPGRLRGHRATTRSRPSSSRSTDLPDDVDPEVRDTPRGGLARLRDLVAGGLLGRGGDRPETETTPRRPTPTETVTTPRRDGDRRRRRPRPTPAGDDARSSPDHGRSRDPGRAAGAARQAPEDGD